MNNQTDTITRSQKMNNQLYLVNQEEKMYNHIEQEKQIGIMNHQKH